MITTYADVKDYLGLANDSDQYTLTRLINAASDFIKNSLNWDIEATIYTETRNGIGSDRMVLKHWPVNFITSVTVDTTVILPASDSTQAGYLYDDSTIYLNGYRFTRGRQNVTVVYSAGFTDNTIALPSEISQLCIDLVALKYKERDRIGQTSQTFAGQTVAFKTWDLTKDQKGILSVYQRRTPMPI